MKLPPEVRSRIAQQLMESVAANDEGDVVFERDDDLTSEERAYVHSRIIASIRSRRAGAETSDADEVMAELNSEP